MAIPVVQVLPSFDLATANLLSYYTTSQTARAKRHPEVKIDDMVNSLQSAPLYLTLGIRKYSNVTLLSIIPNQAGQQKLIELGKTGPYRKVVALGRGTGTVIIKTMRIGRSS